jgi:PEP-CTERM/exosortase A-associated glycosyltransferase
MVIRSLERRLGEVIRLSGPDILHAHSPCLTGVAALRAGRRAGLPVVYEVRALWEDGAVDHGTTTQDSLRYRAIRALETWVLRRADHVTTICEGLRGDIVERGIPSERVTVIPNAVDPTAFALKGPADLQLATKLGLAGKRVIGFIGSFYGYEGLTILLQSLPRMLARHDDIRILLVGGGMQDDALRHEARSLGIADKVVFVGWVPHDQIQNYYGLIEILVYPRLSNRVTELVTPLKPLEAMAQGRLVVASDVGGHRELIRDGDTGLLFRAGDPGALASVVTGILQDPIRAGHIRTAARGYVETERYWMASVKRYADAYRNAIGDPAAPLTTLRRDLRSKCGKG